MRITRLLLVLVGCTSDTIDSAEFLAALVNEECDRAFECKETFPSSATAFDDLFGADTAACKANLAEYYENTAVVRAIKAGTIAYDGKDAATCVHGLGAPSCATYWDEGLSYPDECATAMHGTIAAGGACTIDFECADDMVCEGTCVEP